MPLFTTPEERQHSRIESPPNRSKPLRRSVSRLLFDWRDYELLEIVNEVCCRSPNLEYTRRLYYGHFHPHGIKEMAEARSLRIAYAVVHLLTSLEIGGVDDRLNALRALKAEVLDTAEGPLPKNTARVLLQIMKELVRARGDELQQLQLAHDFRMTAFGKPRVVRSQLRRYHLLEMPEAWNQIAFDDHVHDVNTKGRKSSTHLIMDAWIKGIRRLRVVHYNYIEPRFAAELLEAARILDVDVRIGIEFSARFRGKYVQLIWVPRGFPDAQAFLCFLEEKPMADLMRQGRQVSAYQQRYVMTLLADFNRQRLAALNRHLEVDLAPVDEREFVEFVGIGQKSVLHLEKFIHQKLLEALQQKLSRLRREHARAAPTRRREIEEWVTSVDGLDLELLVRQFLDVGPDGNLPPPPSAEDQTEVPALLQLAPAELLARMAALQSGYRITLNLTDLQVEDVLELLYESNGMITRLELFNLKDWSTGKTDHLPAISRLQHCINEGNPIALKRQIRQIIERVERSRHSDKAGRVTALTGILHDIDSLKVMYQATPLKARIGSDSTGRSPRVHGMGLAVAETLPLRARRQIHRDIGLNRKIIPVFISAFRRVTDIPRGAPFSRQSGFRRALRRLPGLWRFGWQRLEDWQVQSDATRMSADGNVVTLGGAQKFQSNELRLHPPERPTRKPPLSWTYLDSGLRGLLKVLIGFLPAFATFFLTKNWWVLAYGGAFIWFGITGLRNVLQAVLGGGGLRRSPLLRWKSYVDWERVADSLLYTGFSVPLLDWVVKTVLLDRGLGITTETSPTVLYSLMALANGIYLSSHNAFRGLPRAAIVGNFFRSLLSIPIALVFNELIGAALVLAGSVSVNAVLQQWAAIISKAASDTVAGVIEGTADRYRNIQTRYREYRGKLAELLEIYARLELLFPESPTLQILENPGKFKRNANAEALDLEKIIMVHALDMLYFWMYQPRARSAFKQILGSVSEEERQILVTSQFTLLRQKEISQMLIDGVLGQDFARTLSFYLARCPEYLEAMKKYA
jgi:hypothetical protein